MNIPRTIESALRHFDDKKQKQKNDFQSICSLLETHNYVDLDVEGLKIWPFGSGHFNGKTWVRCLDFEACLHRGSRSTFFSAVARSPVLKKLNMSGLYHEKDGKRLLQAAGQSQSLQHLSINNPELYSSSLAQFLQETRSTLTKLTLRWGIEETPDYVTRPSFRSIVRPTYAALSRKSGAGSIESVGVRCSTLAEGVLALEELKHIELRIAIDMSDVYLCNVLQVVGRHPRLCSLTLDCRNERHIELITVALKSSNSLDTLTLEREVYELLERCNTETIDSFFDSLLSCRSLRVLHFPSCSPIHHPWGPDASSFVSHLIRLVNQHPNLVGISCKIETIGKAHQFLSSIVSSVLEDLTVDLGFFTESYYYPEYCRMLAELLSRLPNLKSLSLRAAQRAFENGGEESEEGVFRAVRAHQTLTSIFFNHTLVSIALRAFRYYFNLRGKMADMRACPLDELLCTFASLESRDGFSKKSCYHYDMTVSIIYDFLRERDDWFGVDYRNYNGTTQQEHSKSDATA